MVISFKALFDVAMQGRHLWLEKDIKEHGTELGI